MDQRRWNLSHPLPRRRFHLGHPVEGRGRGRTIVPREEETWTSEGKEDVDVVRGTVPFPYGFFLFWVPNRCNAFGEGVVRPLRSKDDHDDVEGIGIGMGRPNACRIADPPRVETASKTNGRKRSSSISASRHARERMERGTALRGARGGAPFASGLSFSFGTARNGNRRQRTRGNDACERNLLLSSSTRFRVPFRPLGAWTMGAFSFRFESVGVFDPHRSASSSP